MKRKFSERFTFKVAFFIASYIAIDTAAEVTGVNARLKQWSAQPDPTMSAILSGIERAKNSPVKGLPDKSFYFSP